MLIPLKGQGQGLRSQNETVSILNNQSGQIVLEYILLLVISVGLAMAISKGLVGRNAESPGVITGAWSNVVSAIGNDVID